MARLSPRSLPLLFLQGAEQRRGLALRLHANGRGRALLHGALDVQVHLYLARLQMASLARDIQLPVDSQHQPARLHGVLVLLRLHRLAAPAQVLQHAHIGVVAHLPRQLPLLEPVDQQLRDVPAAQDPRVQGPGEDAAAEVPRRVARDAATHVNALLVHGVPHDRRGAEALARGRRRLRDPRAEHLAVEFHVAREINVLLLLHHLPLALSRKLRELGLDNLTAREDVRHAPPDLLKGRLQPEAVRGGRFLLHRLRGGRVYAPAPLDEEPFLISQSGGQTAEPFQDLHVVVADVPGVAQEAGGREGDDRHDRVHASHEQGLVPSQGRDGIVARPEVLQVLP